MEELAVGLVAEVDPTDINLVNIFLSLFSTPFVPSIHDHCIWLYIIATFPY